MALTVAEPFRTAAEEKAIEDDRRERRRRYKSNRSNPYEESPLWETEASSSFREWGMKECNFRRLVSHIEKEVPLQPAV